MKTETKDVEIIIRNTINEILPGKADCPVFNGREGIQARTSYWQWKSRV